MVILLLVFSGCGSPGKTATTPAESSTAPLVPPPSLDITVIDVENQPLPKATVTVLDGNRSTTTRFDGKAVFIGLPAGTHQIGVRLSGYEPSDFEVVTFATGSVESIVELVEIQGPLVGIIATGGSGRCREAPLPIGESDGRCDDLVGDCPDCVAPRMGGLPHDMFRLDARIHWEDEVEGMQFQLRFVRGGATVPLRDGTTTWIVEGTSPVNVTIDERHMWNALRAQGSALEVRALKPSDPAPREFDLVFHAEGFARHYDPSTLPENRTSEIVFDQAADMPREGSTPFEAEYVVESDHDVYRLDLEIERACPTSSAAAAIRLTDPLGRSVDLSLGVADVDINACLSPTLRGPSHVLWPTTGAWTIVPLGECTCSVKMRIQREAWPT